MKFLVFAASHRTQSYNRRLARAVSAHLADRDATVDHAEYSEFDMPLYNDAVATRKGVPPKARVFGERVVEADGIIISSPEYNWSYPGSLKTIIDWTSRMTPNPLAGKTALLMSATTGPRGGIVCLTHLRSPLEALQVFVFPRHFPLPNAATAFDHNDTLTDSKLREQLSQMVDDYLVFTRKLLQP